MKLCENRFSVVKIMIIKESVFLSFIFFVFNLRGENMFLIVLKTAPITLSNGSGDFAAFVVVFTVSITKKPSCSTCPW